ncbi:MAG: DinB family protein, partial [Acidobacteriota bacterium]
MAVFWNEVLGRQYVTAIEMLRNAIAACPEEIWDDRTEGTPFWHIAYHALFYCDLYCSDDLESFQPPEYHVDHYHFLPGDYKEYGGVVTTPAGCYAKEQLLAYADHCTEKGRAVFAALTEERARQRCGF